MKQFFIRIFFVAITILQLFSCTNKTAGKKQGFGIMRASLQRVANDLHYSNQRLHREFEEKSNDYVSKDRARELRPIIDSVNFFSDKMQTLILEASRKIENDKEDFQAVLREDGLLDSIFHGLRKYDDIIRKKDLEFKLNIAASKALQLSVDSIVSSENFYDVFFADRTKEEILLNLQILSNEIFVLENTVINFCLMRLPYRDLTFEKTELLVGQSAEIVKPGGEIIVTSGVGAFSVAAAPRISLDGQYLKTDYGVATGIIHAPKVPGKYEAPIVIEFVKDNGEREKKEFMIKYEVADIK